MGYCASGFGSVTANSKESYHSIIELIERNEGKPYSALSIEDHTLVIELQYEYEKYHDDEALGFLIEICPFVSEGMIEFEGEDDYHWAFKFDPDTGQWNEFSGRMVYGMSSYSDDELIKELQNRGYVVSKPTLSSMVNLLKMKGENK